MAGVTKYLKLLIPAAIFIAVYSAYKDRGMQAIADDLRALFTKVQANPGMLVGLVASLIVPIGLWYLVPKAVKQYAPKAGIIGLLIVAAVTYFAVGMVATKVQEASMGAGAGGTPPAMPQRPRTMMYGRGGRTA